MATRFRTARRVLAARPLAKLAALVGVLLVAAFGFAPAASAHASLLFTTPAAGTAVPVAPDALVLVFDEHIAAPAHALTLTSSTGSAETLAAPTLSAGGTTLTAKIAGHLPSGAYTVQWQVISADGDNVSGSYQFAIGSNVTGALSTGAGTTNSGADWSVAAARWAQFAALAVLLGEAALRRMVRGRDVAAAAVPRPWTRAAAGVGILASLVLTGLVAGSNSLTAALTHPSTVALTSRPGLIAVVETAAFVLALLLSLRWQRFAWVPVAAVVAGEALRAHPGDYAGGWGELTSAAHVAAAAIWVGALVQALRYILAARRNGKEGRPILLGYAGLAAWLFLVVVATGVLESLIIVPLHGWLTTAYGWTLIIKLTLVLAVTGYALASRLRLHSAAPRIAYLRAEATLLVTILAVTATLTATPPPRTVTTALPIAPAPVGPVVYLGNRAGQIGVTLAASSGQAVIHLFAPGADKSDEAAGQSYQLAAVLDPAGTARTLALRGCGSGCFVAQPRWRPGTNQLALRVGARGWSGGTVSLAVPWPPHPDPAALTRLAQTLRGIASMTDYERVTSDTSTGPGKIDAIRITGPRFLSVEPYSNGRATAVNSIHHADGTFTIQIGYPDQNIYAELDLDPSGRPVHETLTDPDHLITRSFTYPEPG